MLHPEVEKAIAELCAAFSPAAVTYEADADGGARTRIEPIVLPAPPYNSPTWFEFLIPHTYPYAEVYPIYTRVDLRQDGRYMAGMCVHDSYRGGKATQLSRKITRYQPNPDFDTAASRLMKTIQWLKEAA